MPTSSKTSAGSRRTVPLVMLVVACGHFNRIGISVAGTERIIPDYGISPENMGLIYSAFLLSYTLAMLPGGWFIDRFGARAALLLLGFGSTFFVALTGGMGLITHQASTLWLGLFVVRALLGLVNAPLHPAAARTVHDCVPAQSRALANGLVTFSACVGIAATFYLMGALIDFFPWPAAFLISAGMTLAVSLAWLAGMRPRRESPDVDPQPHEATFPPLALSRVLRSRGVICITLSYTALNYFQYLFFYWVAYYFETIQKQDRGVARGYSAMITLAMGVGMVTGGWLTDRVPTSLSPRTRRALVPALGMIASGLVFELGLITHDMRLTLGAFAIAAALIGACEGAFWTTVVELGGRFGGTAAGLMNMGGNAGGTLSPYLTPLLGTLFASSYGPDLGWRLSLAIAGAVAVAGAGLWVGIDPSRSD
ncbi:MAG: MFS transporter [Isosphaeraceae bacterium]|nr:MFS transporter [Isosphaeraceae bacterium]